MMTHIRQQIRDAIGTIISDITGTPIPSTRIYKSRSYPMDVDNTNAACISTPSANHETGAMGQLPANPYHVFQDVIVEIWSTGSSATISDTIDGLSEKVEEAIAADPTLSGLVKNLFLVSDEQVINTDGGNSIGAVTLTYSAIYRRAAANAGATLP